MLVDHGISKEDIEAQFAISKAFFDLPMDTKSKTPHDTSSNNGWEYKVNGKLSGFFECLSDLPLQAQLRPSTGTYDQKESLWLQRESLWPSDEDVPNFKQSTTGFMTRCAAISDQVCKFIIGICFDEFG